MLYNVQLLDLCSPIYCFFVKKKIFRAKNFLFSSIQGANPVYKGIVAFAQYHKL